MDDKRHLFLHLSNAVAEASGRPAAFILAALTVLAWAATGPMFDYSETWQLVINTGTTIVTFLMVFLLQNSQNRDSRAIQTKLNELILHTASDNRYIGVEQLDDDELRALSDRLIKLAAVQQGAQSAAVEAVEQAVATAEADDAVNGQRPAVNGS
jgi:low affinity Fe/Cu permease